MPRLDLRRAGATALLVIVAACSKPAEKTGTLSPGLVTPKSTAPGAASSAPPTPAAPPPDVPERWQILLHRGQRWALHYGFQNLTLAAEVTDVRPVGAATVVRLAWRLGAEEYTGYGLPEQIALTAKGAFFLSESAGDAAIRAALASPATVPEPPVAVPEMSRKDGRYLVVTDHDGESVVCVGDGPLPDAGPCDDTCDAQVCFGSKRGFTLVYGNYAPGKGFFEAAKADAGR